MSPLRRLPSRRRRAKRAAGRELETGVEVIAPVAQALRRAERDRKDAEVHVHRGAPPDSSRRSPAHPRLRAPNPSAAECSRCRKGDRRGTAGVVLHIVLMREPRYGSSDSSVKSPSLPRRQRISPLPSPLRSPP
jgi:hypothetical protein